jgi:hypothetical protein
MERMELKIIWWLEFGSREDKHSTTVVDNENDFKENLRQAIEDLIESVGVGVTGGGEYVWLKFVL